MGFSGRHQRSAHRASRSSRSDNQCSIRTDLQCLVARNAHVQGWVLLGILLLQIVRRDDDSIGSDVKTEFHPTYPELAARTVVELDGQIGTLEQIRSIRQLLEHLFDGEPERLKLLLFHPENVSFTRDCGDQSEPATTRFSNRIDPDSLGVPTGNWSQKIIVHKRKSLIQTETRQYTCNEHLWDMIAKINVHTRLKNSMRRAGPELPGRTDDPNKNARVRTVEPLRSACGGHAFSAKSARDSAT